MPNEGDVLTVSGKSLKGKSRVQQHGSRWIVKKIWPDVACENHKPAILLSSEQTGYERWVSVENDRDFFVTF